MKSITEFYSVTIEVIHHETGKIAVNRLPFQVIDAGLFLRRGSYQTINATISRATILRILIIGLIAGPAVSL